MRKLFLLIILMISSVVISQTKAEVDQRLIDNHGNDIYEILEFRKDYYKFLLWELDNAYEIVAISSLSNPALNSINNIVDSNGNAFSVINIDNPETLNFIKYNFVRQKELDVYYDLGDGRAIKFTALKVMWQQFRDSGLNTKD